MLLANCGFRQCKLIHEWIKKKAHKLARMIKNKIFKQGIGIAEKAKKQKGIAGVVANACKPYFDSVSQNRDLWFTLPPQRSLLVSWFFSAIPIPCLKILFFYHSFYILK